jgi:hypothetical protein
MGAAISSDTGQFGTKTANSLTFLEILFAIVIGWLLVALWQRVIENFAYITLGLNKDSTFHALIVALTASIIFVSYTFTTDTILGGTIEKDIEGGLQETNFPSTLDPDAYNQNTQGGPPAPTGVAGGEGRNLKLTSEISSKHSAKTSPRAEAKTWNLKPSSHMNPFTGGDVVAAEYAKFYDVGLRTIQGIPILHGFKPIH